MTAMLFFTTAMVLLWQAFSWHVPAAIICLLVAFLFAVKEQ